MKTKALTSPKPKSKLAPASIDSMEAELDANLKLVREHLEKRRQDSSDAEERARRWKNTISVAQRELAEAGDSLSKNAKEVTSQFLDDAIQRLASIEANEITGPNNELKELFLAEEAMASLKSRLELQRFRDEFATKTAPMPSQSPAPKGLDDESLASIERDLRVWTHSIEALKELRA